MRLLSMEESDRRSIFSPEVDRSASSEGAGAASARLSCRHYTQVVAHRPVLLTYAWAGVHAATCTGMVPLRAQLVACALDQLQASGHLGNSSGQPRVSTQLPTMPGCRHSSSSACTERG